MSTVFEPSKHNKRERYFYKLSSEERERTVKILESPEVYDLSKFKKTKTVLKDELNLYIPEKWKYQDII